MQIQSLRIKSYRSWKIDDRAYSDVAKKKFKLLCDFEKLRVDGGTESIILSVLGISRSTFYRIKAQYDKCGFAGLEPRSKRPQRVRKPQWDKSQEDLVLSLRRQEPTWGKNKIHRLMIRDHGISISVTTVGRIISKLIAKNKVKSAYFAANKDKPKRRRVFDKHATRWKYSMKATKPGEMVQIDHMTVCSNSSSIKHFKAVCPVSKFMVCEVYYSAGSRKAAEFLRKVINDMPFKISSIQVDGGSEFMKDFESLCKELEIKLLVLPPRSPKYNGNVERCNGVTRDDFYSQSNDIFNVATVRGHLKVFQGKYNGYRPHQALHNLTPMEYLKLQDQNRAA
jgi:putative transposase